MLRSPGRRFLVVGFLTLLMFVPLFFAAEIINSRKHYSQETIRSVSQEWGGKQILTGPVLVIPVERTVIRMSTRPKLDPSTGIVLVDAETGKDVMERFEETVVVNDSPVYVLPTKLEANIDTKTQIRNRGIFNVPVYQADIEIGFDFDADRAGDLLEPEEVMLWDRSRIVFDLSNNRALRGVAQLRSGETELSLEPRAGKTGFEAALGDPREMSDFTLALGLNGAQSLRVAPVGRDSHVSMTSDWPHPSFDGAFLPDGHEITDAGFAANWAIPHLARPLPQMSRTDNLGTARHNAFGVSYIEPNDFYQKAYRAAKYGLLFVALTFLTVVLIERGVKRPVHPVQYILIGLVQSVFLLLMVSYAEHLGFGPAYALSAGAVIALLTLFGWLGLKLGRRSLVLGCVLIVVYAVLYLILQSADYALMAGATLAFLALALTMYVTRDEDWYGPEREKGPGLMTRLFGRMPPAPSSGAAPAPSPKAPG